MSIVRYMDKKTGKTVLYESTPHYDSERKHSRPICKYLGAEDPITGKLISSTGKPGRKPKTEKPAGSEDPKTEKAKKEEPDYKEIADKLREECNKKDSTIQVNSNLQKQQITIL